MVMSNSKVNKMNEIEVQVNGVDFECLTQGHGPLVLLVHGFPDIPQTWASQRANSKGSGVCGHAH